jgi:hypothetical protein
LPNLAERRARMTYETPAVVEEALLANVTGVTSPSDSD